MKKIIICCDWIEEKIKNKKIYIDEDEEVRFKQRIKRDAYLSNCPNCETKLELIDTDEFMENAFIKEKWTGINYHIQWCLKDHEERLKKLEEK